MAGACSLAMSVEVVPGEVVPGEVVSGEVVSGSCVTHPFGISFN